MPIIHCAARFGRSIRTSTSTMPFAAISAAADVAHPRLDSGLERDAAERRDHRDPPAREVVRAELGFPTAVLREARRIERVVARAHVVVARRVAHGTRETTEHDRARTEPCVGTARDASVGALHAEQPGVAGGDADRSAAVAAGRERHEPTGDRGRAARRRAAGRAAVPPRVVRDAVELRHADVEPAELARGREPDRHDARPRRTSRRITGDVDVATRSRNTSDASVAGQPATGSSSLTPTGTPPNGCGRRRGAPRRARARHRGTRTR